MPPGSSGWRRTSRRARGCATAARAASTLPGPEAPASAGPSWMKSRAGHYSRGTKSLDPTVFFTPDEVARARSYHRPLYLALAADIALSTLVTALLAFGWLGDRLYAADARAVVGARDPLHGARAGRRRARAAAALVLAGLHARAPLGVLDADRPAAGRSITRRGSRSARCSRPRRWWRCSGRSTSSRRGGRWSPRAERRSSRCCSCSSRRSCSSRCSTGSSRWSDGELADGLLALARRARVPVREVLVADASRRTRKHNAYVSGLGRTRRVVLYDTLLARRGKARDRGRRRARARAPAPPRRREGDAARHGELRARGARRVAARPDAAADSLAPLRVGRARARRRCRSPQRSRAGWSGAPTVSRSS